MTSIASLLPMRGLSPSANNRTSSTPALVVLMVTATRAAIREPVRAGPELGAVEEEMGADSEGVAFVTGARVGRADSTGRGGGCAGAAFGAAGTTTWGVASILGAAVG